MWAWLKPVLDSVLSSVLAAAMQWWRQEQAEAAKSRAAARKQQLRSVKRGLEAQAAMAKKALQARRQVPASGKAWNAKAAPLIACLLLTGCARFQTFSEPLMPVPMLIDRPTFDDESPFTEREQALADYAAGLESTLWAVRAYAIERNQENGYPVTAEQEQWLNYYQEYYP